MSKSRQITGREALTPSYGVDYIVQHPHSSNILINPETKELEPRLSVMSEMSIVAALTTWQAHPDSTLVITGESCFGDDFPNTAELMVAKAKEISNIPMSQLVALDVLPDGRALNNTYLQFEALAYYFSNIPHQRRILASTLSYHMARFEKAARSYGITADMVTAENILHEAGINDYDRYLPEINKGTRFTEPIARAANIIDPKGHIFNLLMEKSGARVVDIEEDEQGNLAFENTLGPRKLEKLRKVIAKTSPAS